jgi:hypothetical protein
MMTATIQTVLASPAVRGALAGLISAALVDFAAFRSWKTFHDAYVYDWGTASWRWLQGAIVGAVTGSGLSVIS